MHRTISLMLLIVATLSARGQAEERVDFAHDVLPLLKQRCAACHTNGKYKGGLSMDTRETLLKAEVVVPGKSEESPLIDRVMDPDPEQRMPPKGPPLTAEQIATLRNWIDQGLPWQDGFSFAKAGSGLPLQPRRPELPPARGSQTNPVDRLVDAYFAEKRITPPEPLDDASFFRRVSLDLVGLLPTPEQLEAFLADPAPDKRERLVRRLLDDDQAYAEHWLTFWNDLLRNDYAGTGYIDGGRKAITTWLYRALRENMPYDQFVRELISPTPESEGFIKGIKWRGRVNASQVPEIQFAQNVGQVFLGINLKCASCHDSFIDSWKLEDAYGLAAIVAETPLEIHRCDKPTGAKARAKFLFPELGQIDPSQPREERLRQLAELLTSRENGLLARTIVNRLWHRLLGRGIVHPVDVMSNEPWSADLLDYLASDLVEHGYDLKRTIALIATSRAYQSRSIPLAGEPTGEDYVFQGPIARRMTAEQFLDAIWQVTDTAPNKPAAPLERSPTPVRASLVVADALMRSLGRPNREQVVTTRPEELSTLQALDLTNGQVLADLLERGAHNLRNQHPDWDYEQFSTWIFLSTLSRRPTPEEQAVARDLLGAPISEEGLSDLLWTVFMLPEFQLIR
ncbi:MAG: PSD1 domain-containing protein [Isosphaeraceae bacterium]|nr:PSD1 domain-containing protein [Isosphaeraceae bacterium]